MESDSVALGVNPMNTPKLLSITAILALALTGAAANVHAQAAKPTPTPKQDAITLKSVTMVFPATAGTQVSLGGVALSKAAIQYVSSDPSILSVSDSTGKGTVLKPGTVTVTATTASTPAGYISAPPVTATYTINPKADSITFKSIATKYVAGGATQVPLKAAAVSKAAIHYESSDPSIFSVNDATGNGTILQAGTVTVTASIANPIVGFATVVPVTATITIAKAAAPKIYPVVSNTKPVYSLGATLNINIPSGKGLPQGYNGTLSYSVASGNATVDTSSGLVTLIGAGPVVVNVTSSASTNYLTAPVAPVKFTVALGTNATINPVSIADTQFAIGKTVTIPTPALSPSEDATGGTFVYSTKSKTAKVSGSTITLTGAGPVTILAAWSGSAKYAKSKAPVEIATFSVSKADDVLTKTPIAAPAPGASVALPALVSSPGKAKVVYTQTSGSGATVASGKVTPSNAGTGFVVVSGTTVATVNFNAATPIIYTVGWSYSSATKKYSFSAN